MWIFKIYRTVCCCVSTLILLLGSMCSFYWGTLPTWQRILSPRSILLISLMICRWNTARIPWESSWHCIKLLRLWLEPVLIVVLRVPKLLLLLVIEGCLFRWTTQSIAFNLKLCCLILCLFIIGLWWTAGTPYHQIWLIESLQWLSGLLLKRKRWHNICLADSRIERWHRTVFNVRPYSSPCSSLLLQFIVLVL